MLYLQDITRLTGQPEIKAFTSVIIPLIAL